MRLNDFESIDEIVSVGKVEFQKRSFAPTINWMPSRQNVYTSQCKKYADMFLMIVQKASEMDIISADMNPSQFVKSAQDFQLSARIAEFDKNVILDNFMKLANIGMMLKRYYYNLFLKKVSRIKFVEESAIIEKAHHLNGLLRAYSETIYFDDHTVSGEFYGDMQKDKKPVIVRSYKRLCPKDFLPGFEKFHIQRIETYCQYRTGKVDFDCLGNIQYLDYLCPDMEGFYGECFLDDGRKIPLYSVSAIDKIINILENQLKNVLGIFFNADEYVQECFLLESAYYAFKPILEKLNYDWKPSNEDIEHYVESLTKKAEFDRVAEEKNISGIKKEQDILRIIDPRCDII